VNEQSGPERDLATSQLVRHAIAEAKLLARAEIAHARLELKQEARAAAKAGALLGGAATLALVALTLCFAAIALALPLAPWLGLLLVALGLLCLAAVAGAWGHRKLPKKPMEKTRARLLDDVQQAQERFA
jgi:hypothetical protein